jgi:hypothetical protein
MLTVLASIMGAFFLFAVVIGVRLYVSMRKMKAVIKSRPPSPRGGYSRNGQRGGAGDDYDDDYDESGNSDDGNSRGGEAPSADKSTGSKGRLASQANPMHNARLTPGGGVADVALPVQSAVTAARRGGVGAGASKRLRLPSQQHGALPPLPAVRARALLRNKPPWKTQIRH